MIAIEFNGVGGGTEAQTFFAGRGGADQGEEQDGNGETEERDDEEVAPEFFGVGCFASESHGQLVSEQVNAKRKGSGRIGLFKDVRA